MPLTERILAIFPGPRWFWTLVWGLLAIPQLLFIFQIREVIGMAPEIVASSRPGIWEVAAIVYTTVISLWGTRKLARDLERIQPTISHLTIGKRLDAERPIRGLESVAGPLALTAGSTALDTVLALLDYGWKFPLLTAPFSFLIQLPLMTYVWTYLSLLIGMDRLGRQRLALDTTPGDRTLGLRPVGGLAFTGFWVFSLGFAPILITTATSPPTLILNLVFFLIGLGIFLLSLSRIHGQMAEAKQRHLELARRLYADAYAPIGRKPSLRTLDAQTPLLNAADALEKRATGIQEWPFGEVLGPRLAIIITSVIATVIARFLLATFGF